MSSSRKIQLTWDFTLFDDASVTEKLTVMSKWEAVIDDSRNPESDMDGEISNFLEPGKKYRLTVIVEELS